MMKMKKLVWLTILTGAAAVAPGCQGGPASGNSSASAPSVASAATLSVPKPIPGGDFFPDLPHHRAGLIHQFFPVATGAPLYGDGPWAEPNQITDFRGLVVQVFQGGTATDSNGKQYVVDVDNRVFVGEYIDTNGERAVGAFCSL